MTGSRARGLNLRGLWKTGAQNQRAISLARRCLCHIGGRNRWRLRGALVEQGMRISNKILHDRFLWGYQLENITTRRCNVPSSIGSNNHHLRISLRLRGHDGRTEKRALSPSFYSCLNEMQLSRDDAEEPSEMPCVLDAVHGSSIATARNCL